MQAQKICARSRSMRGSGPSEELQKNPLIDSISGSLEARPPPWFETHALYSRFSTYLPRIVMNEGTRENRRTRVPIALVSITIERLVWLRPGFARVCPTYYLRIMERTSSVNMVQMNIETQIVCLWRNPGYLRSSPL